ncbi:MAG TPA: AAA family ATPase [Chloroflexota bacterium]|nr:AAA family ATPase [Chloroflexota bacterium]
MADATDGPTLFVVSGVQGVGKSTVARALAARLGRGAWVSADALQKMIVAGGCWPEADRLSPEAARQLRLRLRTACQLARSFVAAGFSAVVDDVVIGDRIEHLLEEMAGQPFVFVMLTARPEVVRARERGRGTALWREWGWLDGVVRERTRRIGLWLDTSDQTAEETVAAILERGRAEGLVEPIGDRNAPAPRSVPAS